MPALPLFGGTLKREGGFLWAFFKKCGSVGVFDYFCRRKKGN